MKRIIILITTFFPLILMAQVNNSYTIEGKTNKAAKITLQYAVKGKSVTSTSEVINGEFKLTGVIDTKMQVGLMITPLTGMRTITPFWLEPGHIKVSDIDSMPKRMVVFSGTPLNNDEIAYKLALAPYSEKYKKLPSLPVNQKANQEDIAEYTALDKEKKAIDIEFIKNHPNSLVSLNVLYYNSGWDSKGAIPDVTLVVPLFNGLSPEVRNSAVGKQYQNLLNNWTNVQISSVAPDFTLHDQNEKKVSLSDFKGKYVLVDFWASWCHPCRWENPNLIKQYQLYKDKNFIILSISMDGNGFGTKADWLKAISDDHIGEWPQLADLAKGYKNNEARIRYGVSSIPENFLIDPNGKIIGKSLKGEDLNTKLKEIFNASNLK